jgi:hypothetical protein
MRFSSGTPALRSARPHRVYDAAELDNRAVAGALDDAPVMHG